MPGYEFGPVGEEAIYTLVQRTGFLAYHLEAIRRVRFFERMPFTGIAAEVEGSGKGFQGLL